MYAHNKITPKMDEKKRTIWIKNQLRGLYKKMGNINAKGQVKRALTHLEMAELQYGPDQG